MKFLQFILKHKILIPVTLVTGIYFIWIFTPIKSVFSDSYSTLIFDTNGLLLRVYLANDEQYRFPELTSKLPVKYQKSLIAFEDKRFFKHPGIDPIAIGNAFLTNITKHKRVRGGSTITMQVARLANPKQRTYFNKIIEIFNAFKFSIHLTKNEILQLYASHVPMGGNIIGIQAASYRYYGKPAEDLTWAEAALFVVLPNSPSMINLERNRPKLLAKRNQLLQRLYEKKIIDNLTLQNSILESLPDRENHIPFKAPQFCNYVNAQSNHTIIHSTLDDKVQRHLEEIIKMEHSYLASLGIDNIAVVVAETKSGKIRGYAGSQDFFAESKGGQVDGVQSARSTGSLLKPFLVAKALDRGPYTIKSAIQDVPTYYGTFIPQNADKQYSGLVTLEQLLVQSLNVPSVRLLNTFGTADFYDFLKQAGFTHLFRSPEGYGLTLILGGAEASLWELTELYTCLGNMGIKRPLLFDNDNPGDKSEKQLFSKGGAWLVLNVLNKLERPGSEFYWSYFDNQVPVAWKTGTSYGQKDGWAIGVNNQWTIGVWIGNFNGVGNASIGGAKSAAPVLFTLFNSLTDKNKQIWFTKPDGDLEKVVCCAQSGFPAGANCPDKNTLDRPVISYVPGTCPYHQKYIIDKKSGQAVCSLCWSSDTTSVYPYIVPPLAKELMEKAGRKMDEIPRHTFNCPNNDRESLIELLYPVNNLKIFIPRDIDGAYQKVVFSAKHNTAETTVFWYLDDNLAGETRNVHELAVELFPGDHYLTIQDTQGYKKSVHFNAYRKDISK